MEFVFGFFFGRCFWLGGVGFRNVRFLVEGVWFDFRFCRLSGESFYLYIERIIFLVLIGGQGEFNFFGEKGDVFFFVLGL